MIRSAFLGQVVFRQLVRVRLGHQTVTQTQFSKFMSGSKADEKPTGVKNEEYFRKFVRSRGFKETPETESHQDSERDAQFGPNEGSIHSEESEMVAAPDDVYITAKPSPQDGTVVKPGRSLPQEIGKDFDLSNIRPALKQAGNLAAYVNESDALQKLVKIGVNLHEIENSKDRAGADLLMQLEFETDIKPRLLWLHNIGVPNKGLGKVITKNPMILGESLDSMEDHVRYLESKKFSAESIGIIAYKAPKFLTMDVKEADGKLGFYQKEFGLKGQEVRDVVTRLPKLITFPISTAKWCKYTLREFLGFSESEAKDIFISNPKVLLSDKNRLMSVFDFLYHTMKIPHEQMVDWPQIFRTRLTILKQRHGFLEKIGRAQYDPTKENYVSFHKFVGNDVTFCKETAKRPLSEYNDFLKSL